MARSLLIRDEHGVQVVSESAVPLEKDLHDVLASYPQLVPSDDLGMGPTAVIGRESGLQSGYADLVLVDADARVCLVEVKKEGNPETRRIVAQLIDYAAALWQMSAGDFERTILQPYLRAKGVADPELLDLGGFAAAQFGEAVEGGGEDSGYLDDFARRLESTLSEGAFRLVVAAPSVPVGVQQAIEYLNSRGMLIYGLEVSYFAGPAECFVPRVVVRPSVAETKRAAVRVTAVAAEDFFESLDAGVRDPLEGLLSSAAEAGAEIRWNASGPTIRTGRTPSLQLASLEARGFGIVIKALQGLPPEPFARARAAAAEVGAGKVEKDEWKHSFRYAELGDTQLKPQARICRHHRACRLAPSPSRLRGSLGSD